MWSGAVQFMQIIKSVVNGFFTASPQLYSLIEMAFFVTLVLSVLKVARYRENGG